jgi:hypothetical protein
MMRNERLGDRAKSIARTAPIYCFIFFIGPVVWQLWLALKPGLVTLKESRRCLLSPYAICIAVFLFALNMASLARGTERIGAGEDGAAPRRIAIHCASLLTFATIGTAVSMSALFGADDGGPSTPIKMIIGSLNGASMCFVFYAASTASVIARLAPPKRRPSEGERMIFAMIRTFNTWLFAIGMPLFIATSLAAASLRDCPSAAGPTLWLLASMAVPVTMGSALFIRADKRIASLLGADGKGLLR